MKSTLRKEQKVRLRIEKILQAQWLDLVLSG